MHEIHFRYVAIFNTHAIFLTWGRGYSVSAKIPGNKPTPLRSRISISHERSHRQSDAHEQRFSSLAGLFCKQRVWAAVPNGALYLRVIVSVYGIIPFSCPSRFLLLPSCLSFVLQAPLPLKQCLSNLTIVYNLLSPVMHSRTSRNVDVGASGVTYTHE